MDLRGLGSRMKSSGPAADAGWTLSGSVIACLLIGYMLGEYFNANPAATITGLFLGIVVGFYNLAKVMWRKQ
jgi:F0F1-type ATP synthase assembly protein I